MMNQKLVTSKESKSESKIMSTFDFFFLISKECNTVSKNVSNTDTICPYVSVNTTISTQKFVTLDKDIA